MLASLCAPLVARAQRRPEDERESPEALAARAAYEDGVARYNIGEFDAAIDAFKKAYLLTRRAGLLFNIAQAYRQKGAGSCALSLRFYRAYLREKPGAPDRADVEARMAELEGCARREEAAAAPVPQAARPPAGETVPPPASSTEPRAGLPAWIPLAASGGGAALAIAGGALLGSVALGLDECTPRCSPDRTDTLRGRATLGYVLLGAGVAAGAAGLGSWWWGGAAPTGRTAWVLPTPAGIAAGGVF